MSAFGFARESLTRSFMGRYDNAWTPGANDRRAVASRLLAHAAVVVVLAFLGVNVIASADGRIDRLAYDLETNTFRALIVSPCPEALCGAKRSRCAT